MIRVYRKDDDLTVRPTETTTSLRARLLTEIPADTATLQERTRDAVLAIADLLALPSALEYCLNGQPFNPSDYEKIVEEVLGFRDGIRARAAARLDEDSADTVCRIDDGLPARVAMAFLDDRLFSPKPFSTASHLYTGNPGLLTGEALLALDAIRPRSILRLQSQKNRGLTLVWVKASDIRNTKVNGLILAAKTRGASPSEFLQSVEDAFAQKTVD